MTFCRYTFPILVHKLHVHAFCEFFYRLGVPEQALGGIPLGLGIVVEGKPSELSCKNISCFHTMMRLSS